MECSKIGKRGMSQKYPKLSNHVLIGRSSFQFYMHAYFPQKGVLVKLYLVMTDLMAVSYQPFCTGEMPLISQKIESKSLAETTTKEIVRIEQPENDHKCAAMEKQAPRTASNVPKGRAQYMLGWEINPNYNHKTKQM